MRSTGVAAIARKAERPMTQDTIVDFPETPVGYIAGDRERPIREQAPIAFGNLEALLPTSRRRRYRSQDEMYVMVAVR
jgi:hypothetical protein